MNDTHTYTEQLLNLFRSIDGAQEEQFQIFIDKIIGNVGSDKLSIKEFFKAVWDLCDDYIKLEKELDSYRSKNIKLPYDLPEDTLTKVRDTESERWYFRYFKEIVGNSVRCYIDGKQSITVTDPINDYATWKYAETLTSDDITNLRIKE